MEKKIILIGNGSYADIIRYYIESCTDWEIAAYADEYAQPGEARHRGLPYVHLSLLPQLYPSGAYEAVIGVGYRGMNENRKRIYETLKGMGYTLPNLIHPTAILNNAKLGDANVIMENCVIGPQTSLGSDNILWSCAAIAHSSAVSDHVLISQAVSIAGNCRIGACCFLGSHATVQDGVTLAEHTLVGGGAYAAKDTKPYAVLVPARSVTLEQYKSTELL